MSFLKAAVDSSSPNILIPSGDFCTAFEGGVRIWSGAHLLRSVLSRNRWLWARAVSAWWFRSQIPVLISYRLFGVNLHHPILLMSLISEIRSTASALWSFPVHQMETSLGKDVYQTISPLGNWRILLIRICSLPLDTGGKTPAKLICRSPAKEDAMTPSV